MNNRAIVKWWLAGMLGVSLAGVSAAHAQSTLGGAKTPPPKIGGAAKPAPVIGGAALYHPPTLVAPKPAPVIGMTKPNAVGGVTTPGATGNAMIQGPAAANARPNPSVTPPLNKGSKVANLKCASGACAARGPKP